MYRVKGRRREGNYIKPSMVQTNVDFWFRMNTQQVYDLNNRRTDVKYAPNVPDADGTKVGRPKRGNDISQRNEADKIHRDLFSREMKVGDIYRGQKGWLKQLQRILFRNDPRHEPNALDVLAPRLIKCKSLSSLNDVGGRDIRPETHDDDRAWIIFHNCSGGQYSARCSTCDGKPFVGIKDIGYGISKLVCKTTLHNRIARRLEIMPYDPEMSPRTAVREVLLEIKLGRPTPGPRLWFEYGRCSIYPNVKI